MRFCKACGLVGPDNGPLSFDWDSHLQTEVVGHKTVEHHFLTCSPECRATLGLVERKRRFDAIPPPPPDDDWFYK